MRDSITFPTLHFSVNCLWNGSAAEPTEQFTFHLKPEPSGLRIEVHAPFFNDPAPNMPPGSTKRLWTFEVVELFFLGPDAHYTEVEFGPFGHYLLLHLRGERQVTSQGDTLELTSQISGKHWHATLLLPWSKLPRRVSHINAYAIHGQGSNRRYLSLGPSLGAAPDFHDLSSFVKLSDLTT